MRTLVLVGLVSCLLAVTMEAHAASSVRLVSSHANAQGVALVGQRGQITAMWQADQLDANSNVFRATFIKVLVPDAYLNGSDAASVQRGPVEFDLSPADVVATLDE